MTFEKWFTEAYPAALQAAEAGNEVAKTVRAAAEAAWTYATALAITRAAIRINAARSEAREWEAETRGPTLTLLGNVLVSVSEMK